MLDTGTITLVAGPLIGAVIGAAGFLSKRQADRHTAELADKNAALEGEALKVQQHQLALADEAGFRAQAQFLTNQLPAMRAEVISLRSEVVNLRNEISSNAKQYESDTKALIERLTAEHAKALADMAALHVTALEQQRQLYMAALALQKAESERPVSERTGAVSDAITMMTAPVVAVPSGTEVAKGVLETAAQHARETVASDAETARTVVTDAATAAAKPKE